MDMEEKNEFPEDESAETEEIHQGQIWFDKIFLLLALSILITGLFYNGWGLWELFR
jgi:hypothetical protein